MSGEAVWHNFCNCVKLAILANNLISSSRLRLLAVSLRGLAPCYTYLLLSRAIRLKMQLEVLNQVRSQGYEGSALLFLIYFEIMRSLKLNVN